MSGADAAPGAVHALPDGWFGSLARRLGSWPAYVVALLPFLVAAVRALRNDWFPIGDGAQLYLRAMDVLTADHPWLGSGTSASVSLGYQVNNAGPLYFDLVAPFARTLPPGAGNVVAVTLLNAGCLVLAGRAARRIGAAADGDGTSYELLVLAAGATLAWTLGSELLFDMFQAHALLFPFLATCVLLTGVAAGQLWVLPWLAFTLTLIAQTHVSYAYILVVVVATAAGIGAVGLRAPRGAALRAAIADSRRASGAAGVVLAVTWFQPLWQQFAGSGEGNLWRLIRSAGGGDVAVGLPNAVRLVAAFVSLPPWATRPGFADTLPPSGLDPSGTRVVLAGMPAGWWCAVALVATLALLVAARWWATRRGLVVLRVLATWTPVVVVGAVLALSRLTVSRLGLAPHHTRWVFVVALLVYVTLVWAAADALALALGRRRRAARPGGHHPSPARAVGVLAAAVVVGMSAANLPAYAQRHGPTATTEAMPALRVTFDAIDDRLADGTWPEPVYYDVSNERIYAPHSSAIQVHLRHRGAEFRITPEFLVRQLGEHRRADGSEPGTVMQFQAWEAYAPPPGCVVARTTGDPAADRATEVRAAGLVDELVAAFAVGAWTVAVPGDAHDADRAPAAAVAGGDAEALAEIALDGRLRYWLDQGWVVVAPDGQALAERLRTEGPELTAWLERLFALVLTDAPGCRG